MRNRINVAIIGCGWAGRCHARSYRRCGAHIHWAVDVRKERATSIQTQEEQVRISTDYQEALNDPQVDAVDICLPHNLHAPVAVAAARAGKHILCEKPIAASLEEADRMIQAAEEAGVVLMVAENVRFSPLYRKVAGLLEKGVIGKPALIQITRQAYLAQSFLEERVWFLNKEAAAGGIMMSGGVHDFEIMRMLIGEIESVYALRARQRFAQMQGDDTSIATVRFRDGTVGSLVESFIMKSLDTASGSEVHTLRIDGDLGSLVTEGFSGGNIYLFSERKGYYLAELLTEHKIQVPEEDTFLCEITHFLESVRTGKGPITNGRSQRKPLEVVFAAYQSMQSGEPVRLC